MKNSSTTGITDEELSAINAFSRKKLTREEVYVFSITLCDNEIDRDFERFLPSALNKLASLFVGKTGIFDHNAKSSNQTARIFKTWVETDKSKRNTLDEPYCALKAKAYMVRTGENEALIKEIEGGIKKEVSVSCAVLNAKCSICGADLRRRECEHSRGKRYSGKLCYAELSEPTDAYEWSFVAVPAQRGAGVTKSFDNGIYQEGNVVEIVKSADGAVSLSDFQVENLKGFVKRLEAFEADARAYREELLSKIEKYAHILIPQVAGELLSGCVRNLEIAELKTFSESLKKQAQTSFPSGTQLGRTNAKTPTDNKAFRI